MLEDIFDYTVDAIEYVSKKTGISYKKLNVILMFTCIAVTGTLLINRAK